jgi:iron complex transport system ATP-binding protein
MIEINQLTCSYNNKTILKDINLDINSHISILGANGSGKSTLAKAICKLIKFDGEILLKKKNTQYIDNITMAKNISYIPAKLEIYDSFISVEEFVLQGRFPYKKGFFDYTKDDKSITTQTLELLNLTHLKNNTVSSLSSGEQQLVLIAQALTQQSKIIIFDEPTANLDPHNSKIIAQRIKSLKEYHQIILITHDLNLASYINSNIVFIKDTSATLYEDDFFANDNLQKLYEVEFNSLAVKYD